MIKNLRIMIKNLRTLALLLFVAASMTAFSACEEKDNDNNTSGNTDASTQVADTEWDWSDLDGTGIIDVSVEFNGPRLVSVITTDMSTGIMDVKVYQGTYTYSKGNGTLSLRDDDTNASVNATFTVKGTTMTLNFRGATYTLTKR